MSLTKTSSRLAWRIERRVRSQPDSRTVPSREGNATWGVESVQLAANRGLAYGALLEAYEELR